MCTNAKQNFLTNQICEIKRQATNSEKIIIREQSTKFWHLENKGQEQEIDRGGL